MRKSQLIAKLFNEGDPILRYLVATRLAKSMSGYNMERLREEMGATKDAAYWFGCLASRDGVGAIHGSKDTCFENAMGKLVSFGLEKGDEELDQGAEVFVDWIADLGEKGPFDHLIAPIVGAILAWGGYWQVEAVREYWDRRVDDLYGFAVDKDYSIYADKGAYRGIPQAFRDKLLVDPGLYREGKLKLPWIYDVRAFTALRDDSARPEMSRKIDATIDYVLDPGYQDFPKGYGIISLEPRRYCALGWSVWLPGFRGLEMDGFETGCLVQRLEIMSHFPNARSSEWFTNCLAHLESFKTDTGSYLFPKEYLNERKNGYLITGGHMGLGEDRRRKTWRELESTYWMLAIKQNT